MDLEQMPLSCEPLRHSLRLLDQALATELVCMFRYRRHYSATDRRIASMFEELIESEQHHADGLHSLILAGCFGTPESVRRDPGNALMRSPAAAPMSLQA